MEHSTGSRVVENIVRIPGSHLPLAFMDSWNEDRMPRIANTLERSLTELQRMVCAYLPPSWYLVAVGMTTSVVNILQDGFLGSQVIVVDWSSDRTRFLYNALQSVYTIDMHVLQHVPTVWSAGPSLAKERVASNVQALLEISCPKEHKSNRQLLFILSFWTCCFGQN